MGKFNDRGEDKAGEMSDECEGRMGGVVDIGMFGKSDCQPKRRWYDEAVASKRDALYERLKMAREGGVHTSSPALHTLLGAHLKIIPSFDIDLPHHQMLYQLNHCYRHPFSGCQYICHFLMLFVDLSLQSWLVINRTHCN